MRQNRPPVKFFLALYWLGASVLLMLGMMQSVSGWANSSPDVQATVFERGSKLQKVLFRFEKVVTQKAGGRFVMAKYTDASGKLALEESIQYGADGSLLKLVRTQHQINEKTTVERKGDKVIFMRLYQGDKDDDDEDWEKNTVTSEQLSGFIRKHWASLTGGEDQDIRLVVPSRRETVGFTIEQVKDRDFNGSKVRVFEMSPSSMFIRAIVKPVFLYFSPEGSHEMLMVDGRMPVKQFEDDGDYSDLDALFVVHNPLGQKKSTQKKIVQKPKQSNSL